MTGQYKIAWLTNAPSGDQIDLLNALALRPEIDLTVIYCSRASSKGVVDYRAPKDRGVALRGVTIPGPGGGLFLNPSILSLLIRSSHDLLIVSGYIHPTMQIAMFLRSVQNKPWILFAERPGLNGESRWSNTLRDLPMYIVQSADAIIATGTMAQTAYKRKFGLSKSVFSVPYLIDAGPFLKIARHPSGGTGRVRFLACGSLIPRKGIDVLIRAFARAAYSLPQITLTIVGDGTERNALEALVPNNFREQITFKGFVPFDERPATFANADVFIHPARHDGWGVVIHEALAAGLPVIATRETGAAYELVEPNHNGFLVGADDEDELTEKIIWFAHNQDQISLFGARARNKVSHLTPEWGAAELVSIANAVLLSRTSQKK